MYKLLFTRVISNPKGGDSVHTVIIEYGQQTAADLAFQRIKAECASHPYFTYELIKLY